MRIYLLAFLLAISGVSASAKPITYNITVNTSSIAGTTGSLDLNFNPGPLVSQSATVQILNFDGTLNGGPSTTGSVSGSLPTVITFTNGTAFNDYFQGIKYGTVLSFSVSLSGPALSSPDGSSSSGSTFAFSMYSDTAGTIPALTTDTTDGFAFLIGVNLDGTTTLTNYSTETTISTPPPASCQLKQIINGPPKQLDIAMQDTHSGLQSVTLLSAVNSTVSIPAFTPGDVKPLIVTATKIDQSKTSTVSFQITNVAGTTSTCDPVDFTATVERRIETHVFRSLSAEEHYIRLMNGSPGLFQATFIVNGVSFHENYLASDQSRVIDVSKAMHSGSNNQIVMVASGTKGASAYVLIGDQSVE